MGVTVAIALLLASHTLLNHDMLDMATHYDSRWDVTTELRVDAAGAATFHVTGSVTSKGIELTPGAGARAVMAEHTTHVDETWTGHATTASSAIVVHFDNHADHGRPYSVDVTWRCDSSATPVSGTATPVWKCATTQNMTRPSPSPGIALPEYFRVPTYLAAPSVSLRVDATARGGADHRSTMSSVTLSR